MNSIGLVSCLSCGFFDDDGAGRKIKFIFLQNDTWNFSSTVYAYLLTRIPYPTCDTYTPNLDAISVCGIPKEAMYPVDHSSCETTCWVHCSVECLWKLSWNKIETSKKNFIRVLDKNFSADSKACIVWRVFKLSHFQSMQVKDTVGQGVLIN